MESAKIVCPHGIWWSVMVVTWKHNDPAYKPPSYFCPMLACTKGGGVMAGFYGITSVHLLVNHRGMCNGILCVWICFHASCYIPSLYVANNVSLGSIFKVCIVWITLWSKVLVIFADHHSLLCFLTSSQSIKETANGFISRLVGYNSSDSSYRLLIV